MGDLFMLPDDGTPYGRDNLLEYHYQSAFWTFERVVAEDAPYHLSPRSVDFFLHDPCHFKEFPDNRHVFSPYPVCQETVVTDISEVLVRDMGDQSLDKNQDR